MGGDTGCDGSVMPDTGLFPESRISCLISEVSKLRNSGRKHPG